MTPDGDRRHNPESGRVVDQPQVTRVCHESVVAELVLRDHTCRTQRWVMRCQPVDGMFDRALATQSGCDVCEIVSVEGGTVFDGNNRFHSALRDSSPAVTIVRATEMMEEVCRGGLRHRGEALSHARLAVQNSTLTPQVITTSETWYLGQSSTTTAHNNHYTETHKVNEILRTPHPFHSRSFRPGQNPWFAVTPSNGRLDHARVATLQSTDFLSTLALRRQGGNDGTPCSRPWRRTAPACGTVDTRRSAA